MSRPPLAMIWVAAIAAAVTACGPKGGAGLAVTPAAPIAPAAPVARAIAPAAAVPAAVPAGAPAATPRVAVLPGQALATPSAGAVPPPEAARPAVDARAYAAPDRMAIAQAALAEDDARPSPFRFGLGTLWRWAMGPFTREEQVDVAPRGPVPGADGFWLGVNLPWVNYGGDFGANAWHPEGGLTRPEAAAKLEAAFARLEAAGVRQVRWFLFCDGRAGLRFAADGTPLGIDDHVLLDMEVALAAARQHRIRVMFALVDFGFLHKRSTSGGVEMGGHADVIRDPAKRQAFGERVVAPLLERFGADPTILAWDVINEPEWAVFGLGAWKPAESVAAAELRAFVRETTARLHRDATQPVTVGSACARWIELVQGVGLDFYQAHWYDHFERKAPLAKPVAKLGLDRPVILGEFPTKGSKKAYATIMDEAFGAGYAGGYAWGMLSTDTCTDYDAAEPALRAWLNDRLGGVTP